MSVLMQMLADRLRGMRKRFAGLLCRSAADDETSREVAFHVDMEAAQNMRRGMTPAAARRAALLSFGGVDRFAEHVRDGRRFGIAEDLAGDIVHAFRGMRRAPSYAFSVLFTLVLVIAANTAVFTVVRSVLLKPLPYPHADRLIVVSERNDNEGVVAGPVSPGTISDMRKRSIEIEDAALFFETEYLLSLPAGVREVRSATVSPGLFGILGVEPFKGRLFSLAATDEAAHQEVVISYELWRSEFGGASDVQGRTVSLDAGRTLTIVGVMPPGFSFPSGTHVWMRELIPDRVSATQRQFRYYGGVALLRPGRTLDGARAELRRLSDRMAAEYPASNYGWAVDAMRLDESIVGNAKPALVLLQAMVACLLLVACANLANLTVARSSARAREVGVRTALGAGRARLVRQWMAEGLVFGTVGGAAGVLFAYGVVLGLLRMAPPGVPRLGEVSFDSLVWLFALCLVAFTSCALGLAPLVQFGGSGGARRLAALKSNVRTASSGVMRTRDLLTGFQIALTLVLMVCGALLFKSYLELNRVDIGFSTAGVTTAELRVPRGRFAERRPWGALSDHYTRLIARTRSIPGVSIVAGTSSVPFTSDNPETSVWRFGAPGASGRQLPTSPRDRWTAQTFAVTPDYFRALRIPLRGRAFTAADRFSADIFTDPDLPRPAGVAIINEAMARRYWPGRDPVGDRIVILDDQIYAAYRTIIAVAADTRASSVAEAASPAVFIPFFQHPGFRLSLVVTSTQPDAEIAPALRETIRAFDDRIAIGRMERMANIVGATIAGPRFNTILVAAFALLALGLCATGIAGVIAYRLALRRREIGIRIALGARGRGVVVMLLASVLKPVGAGIFAGCIVALAATSALRGLLFGVSPSDPVVLVAAVVLMTGVAALAALLPARRAAAVDPVSAMRSE